jgi:hypothetical protein
MTTAQPPGAGGPAPTPWLTSLAAYRQQAAYVLIGLGVAFGAVALYCEFRYGWWGAWEWILWGTLLTAVAAGVGLFVLMAPPAGGLSESEQFRFLLITFGGLVGFLTAFLGLLLPLTRYRDVFAAPLKEWANHPLQVWGVAAALFGGLTLMFASLLLARGVERSSMLMRRLLYGYNAFFSSFLLLAVLFLFNILIHAPFWPFTLFQKEYDWTQKTIYTLSEASEKQLAALKKPVKVYVLLPNRFQLMEEVATLMDNCRAASKQFSSVQISPYNNPEGVRKLQETYQIQEEPFGLLVVYGDESDRDAAFVPVNDLFTDVRGSADEEKVKKYTFKGEAALMAAISFLEEGKSRAVVYFTQGDGELPFTGSGLDPLRGGGQIERGVDQLAKQLGKANYDVRELKLGPDVQHIPSDAGVVVVARPTLPMSDVAVNALREYLHGSGDKKGKLIVLLDTTAVSGAKPVRTGLESLLAEYNVQVGDERIMRVDPRPSVVEVVPDERSRNPVAQAFLSGGFPRLFLFDNARKVEPAPGPGNPSVTVDSMLVTARQLTWLQGDLSASPSALVKEYNEYARTGKADRFVLSPISVAVAVSDSGGAPQIPGHEFLNKGGGPRMVVFGSANWISDGEIQSDLNYDLFASSLYWLREKPNIGVGAAGKPREDFDLKLSDDAAFRLRMVPLGLFLLATIALGLGVWFVRRR